MNNIKYILILCGFFLSTIVQAQSHPKLSLTKTWVGEIQAELGKVPLFDKVLASAVKEVDAEIEIGVKVPIPIDMAGGYTHQRHKRNWFVLQKAGALYQITNEEKYAKYVRDVLMAYAKIYPELPIHPTDRSYATGKIFWQCLNDANWLVYVSQAYDCIYDWLPKEERDFLNKDLFRPYADFLSSGNPQFFNRVHNHSTWGNVAVGMIAIVMDDEELMNRALYGLPSDDISADQRDNDGGYIKSEDQKEAGFFAQLDFSFSPDGYFTEGPYYARYAMMPFLVFAKALSLNRPELNIIAYRDSILNKAVYSMLNMTDPTGAFFPVNDAQKGMSIMARDVVTAVDITYFTGGNDPKLLSIAKKQNRVLLDETGFSVARAIAKGLAQPFVMESKTYKDGADGDSGGIGILREYYDDDRELCLVMKYAAHGGGHGHFDRLSYSWYDEDGEIIQDYGASRWVNIDQKGGGRYLKENNTWAKQTIAHNTVAVNQESQFKGDVKKAESQQAEPFLLIEKENFKAIAAKENNAYSGMQMHRTMISFSDENLISPLLVDVFRIESEQNAQYDLPLWFHGHLLNTNFEYEAELETLNTMGDDSGYQHLWKEAVGNSSGNNAKVTWLNDGKFFSITSFVDEADDLIFARLGANDPQYNLRHDPAFIIRKKDQKDVVFISLIESHGTYNPVSETPYDPFSSIESASLIHNCVDYTAFSFNSVKGKSWTVLIANKDSDKEQKHKLKTGDEKYKWIGPIDIIIY